MREMPARISRIQVAHHAIGIVMESLFAFSLFFIIVTIFKVNIADGTEQQWVTCFQETAEALLGKENIFRFGMLIKFINICY